MFDIVDVLGRTIIGIEDCCGKKQIHYYAYSWYADDSSATPYRFAEYTFFIDDLEKVLKYGITCYESEFQDQYKQYVCDCSEEMCEGFYTHYNSGREPKFIKEKEVSMNTPYGLYILTDSPSYSEMNTVHRYGDGFDLVAPPHPIDFSGFEDTDFDDVEYDLFNVIKRYAEILGLKIITNDDNDIDFCSVKEIEEVIFKMFEDAGVVFKSNE